jgi:cell division septation protein DedD
VAAEVTPQPPRPPERTAKPVEKPPEAAPAVQNAESLQTGTYLQVIATIKTDAEVISKSLQDRRFPAIITPSSLEGRFRVLVGPYKDATALGGAKTELENLGFHPIAVKIAERN